MLTIHFSSLDIILLKSLNFKEIFGSNFRRSYPPTFKIERMKIPKKAKRVYKGKIFEVYEWPQREFDGTYKTYELVKRQNSVQIIATQKGKILMTKERQPDHYRPAGLLGGRIEHGERPLIAAKRELLEETGLASKDWHLLNVYHPFRRILWDIYVFVARDCYSVGKPRPEAGEKIKLQRLNYSDFVKKITNLYWEGDLVSEILQSQQDPRRTRSLRHLILKK